MAFKVSAGLQGPVRLFALLICLMAMLLSAVPAFAQTPMLAPGTGAGEEAATEEVPPEERIRNLLDTLRDDTARQELIGQLETLLGAQETVEAEEEDSITRQLLLFLGERVSAAGHQFAEAGNMLDDVPRFGTWLMAQAENPRSRSFWLEVVVQLGIVLGAAIVAELLTRRLLRRPRRAVERPEKRTFARRILMVVIRTILVMLPVVAFVVVAYAALALFSPPYNVRMAALALINGSVIARLLIIVAFMILAPNDSHLRPIRLDDQIANYFYIWARRLTRVAVYGFFILRAAELLGTPFAAVAVLERLLGILVAGLIIVFILQNRRSVARLIAGKPKEGRGAGIRVIRARLADIWPGLAILYVVGMLTVWLLRIQGGFGFVLRATGITVLVIVISMVVSRLVRELIDRAFRLSPDLKSRFPTLEKQANRYLPVLHRIAQIVISVVSILFIMEAWGIDAFGWIEGDTGAAIIGRILRLFIIVAGAVLVLEVLNAAIERYLNASDTGGSQVVRSARARTLLPLLRKFTFVIIVVVVGLILLSEIGIDIAPLLAGAGIIGLAVGFGAQTLVKDVITGLFILMQDLISVGDVVTVAGHGGVVESISIRTIQLRDLSGTVRTVPFSEVGTIENMTRDFSYYLLDVGVAYREDTDEVIEVLQGIADEMEKDPEHGPNILPPFEVLGVDRFEDSAVIVRCRIKTLPIKQWGVGREFNRRMKKRFDELGIEIPFPHRTIYYGVDKDGGNAPPAQVSDPETPTQLQAQATLARISHKSGSDS